MNVGNGTARGKAELQPKKAMRPWRGGTFARALILAGVATFLFAPAGATLQNLQVGMKAPSFSLSDQTGTSRGSASFGSNKLTVILFWSTWSRQSETALLRMDKLHRQYRDKGLEVIAVNADSQTISESTTADIRARVLKLNLALPVVIDRGLATFHDYGVIALPSLVVADSSGMIRHELSGYPLVGAEELVRTVAAILEGTAHAASPRDSAAHQPTGRAQLLFNMGTAALKSGSADSAAEKFALAAEADPQFALPQVALGEIFLKKGDTARAKEAFARALSREPAHVAALCKMALILADEGKIDEGKALVAKAAAVDGSYPPARSSAGYLLGKSGHLAEGLRLLDEAAALDPHAAESHLLKGRLLEENQRTDEAAAAYRAALELLLGLK